MPRIVDHLQAMEEASAAGMRAVLFKDHYYPSAPIAELLKTHYGHLAVEPIGGVVLNNAAGGFNVYALEAALKLGTRMVWMPTVSAANHIRHGHRKELLKSKTPMRRPTDLTVLDAHGRLKDEVKECLDIIAEYDAGMSGGHLHITEVFPLMEAAKAAGIKRLLLNHPTYTCDGTVEDIRDLAGMGVMIEHSICMFIESRFKCFSPEELKSYIDAGGVGMTFFGSDLGQNNNPTPVEGFRQIIKLLLSLGYDETQVRQMVSDNAARFIGLQDNAQRPN
jgi:hypothetical protein